MGKYFIYAIALLLSLQHVAFAENDDTLVLYQVGKAGSYCVSLSPSDKGCISGMGDGEIPVNVLNLMKDKVVVWKNVSDAIHDMQFTGANARDLPAQRPGAGDAVAKMAVEDPSKQRITCSYHGAQLTVGYTVIPKTNMAVFGEGHKDPAGGDGGGPNGDKKGGGGGRGPGGEGGGGGGPSGIGKISNTRLADVANEIIAKAPAGEVSNLVKNRPDLLPKLAAVRPLLAQEISSAGGFPTDLAKGLGGLTQTGLNFNGTGGANGALAKNGAGGVGGAGGAAGGLNGKKVAQGGSLADGLGNLANDLEPGGGGGIKKRKLSNYDELYGTQVGEGGQVVAGGGRAKTSAQKMAEARAAGVTGIDGSMTDEHRTKLKLAKARHIASTDAMEWNKYLILLLLIGAVFAVRWVIVGTRSKKKSKAA